jgi:hypothetical protein
MQAARLLCLVLMAVAPLAAQQQSSGGRDVGTTLATREQLREALARLEREDRLGAEAALIRSRLDSGDFQPGDRILVRVEGEQQLSDTFTVGPGPALVLLRMGVLPLGGVLRSELTGRLTTHLARYLRNPVVQARPLIRILVEGDVGKPGFYAVPPELPLADVITVAGGLTQRAKATRMRIERGPDEIWSGERLRQALGRGYSLDQLNLRAGDRVFVPTRGDFARTAGIIGALVAIPVAIYSVWRWSR